jgi:hypothetical protein
MTKLGPSQNDCLDDRQLPNSQLFLKLLRRNELFESNWYP